MTPRDRQNFRGLFKAVVEGNFNRLCDYIPHSHQLKRTCEWCLLFSSSLISISRKTSWWCSAHDRWSAPFERGTSRRLHFGNGHHHRWGRNSAARESRGKYKGKRITKQSTVITARSPILYKGWTHIGWSRGLWGGIAQHHIIVIEGPTA